GLPGLPSKEEAKALFGTGVFDCVMAREPWRGEKDPRAAFAPFAQAARELLADHNDNGTVITLQSPPGAGQRLSVFIEIEDANLAAQLAAAEDAFFAGDGASREAAPWAWTAEDLVAAFAAAGFVPVVTDIEHREERIVGEADLAHWFDRAKSPWGKFIGAHVGEAAFAEMKARISAQAKTGPLVWRWKSVLVKASVAAPLAGKQKGPERGAATEPLPSSC
ncbi:MAG: hypothetical protein LBL31_04760, partial [Spirochaetaceae bacterium]|nr:hypothetical protein [Spirochaetaceae bacterium]